MGTCHHLAMRVEQQSHQKCVNSEKGSQRTCSKCVTGGQGLTVELTLIKESAVYST